MRLQELGYLKTSPNESDSQSQSSVSEDFGGVAWLKERDPSPVSPQKIDLVIFDIDDTLMHTTARIRVVKDGEVVRELTNQQFNNYQLLPGESFDFGEFRSAEKFRQESQPIKPMINKLKNILAYHPSAKVIMLTARADFDNKQTFLQTFRDLGIDMSRVHVHRAGNLPGDAIPAEKKAVYVRRYLDTGKYRHVRLYDDSMTNLIVFKTLKREYPRVDFKAIYVGPGGVTRTVEQQEQNQKPAPIYYFAYGMLTDPRLMSDAELVGTARLPNHSLEFRGYANVIPSRDSVPGVLWSVDRKKLHDLDQAEGYPSLYDRKTVPVLADGQRYEAMIYTMTPATKQHLKNRKPSRSYVMRLVKGYNAAGIPLSKITQAIENASLDEASMNPASFAQAVQSGAEQGVLVGYEFEVCVPPESIVDSKKDITANQVRSLMYEYNALQEIDTDYNIEKFNNFFTMFKPRVSIPYQSLPEARQAMMEERLPELVQAFYDIPEETRKQYVKSVLKKFPADKFSPLERQFAFASELGSTVRAAGFYNRRGKYKRLIDQGSKLYYLAGDINTAEDVLKWMFDLGEDELYSRFNRLFEYEPRQAYDFLELDNQVADDFDDYGNSTTMYKDAANGLQPTVQQTFGAKTNVFTSYHQRRKNMTDWYIEPDGSIDADKGGTGVEIVSPPLPANEAMAALKKFFAMANQLKLYTNKSTGLHINVSIPKKLDVLKLAVFLGDQYVLRSFGREFSRYAKSVERELATPGRIGLVTKEFKSAADLKPLSSMVRMISGNHFASINDTGKYISFRHAGGDYLADQGKIENTVGRFIRAMLIASDPNAFRQEYMTKLAKLIPGQQKPPTFTGKDAKKRTTLQKIADIRSKGLLVLQIDRAFVNPKPNRNLAKVNVLMVKPNSEAAKQNLLSKIRGEETRELLQKLPIQNFYSVLIPADTTNDRPTDGVGVLRSNDPNYFVSDYINLPMTEPVVKAYVMKLVKPYLKPTAEN